MKTGTNGVELRIVNKGLIAFWGAFVFLGMGFSTIESAMGCDQACVQKNAMIQNGMTVLKKAVLKHSLSGSQDPACPKAGAEEVTLSYKKDTILGELSNNLDELKAQVSKQSSKFSLDVSKCGTDCRQLNVISPATIIFPQVDKTISADTQNKCLGYATKHIKKIVPNEDAGQEFLLTTMKGEGEDGPALYQACPDPCSFYVYVAATNLSGGRKSLNLTVQCGPPRVVVGATGRQSPYQIGSKLIHEWTCVKAK